MATPTLSIAAHSPTNKSNKLLKSSARDLDLSNINDVQTNANRNFETTLKKQCSNIGEAQRPRPRHITEEINDDSIYSIHLKRITYTFNSVLNKQSNNCNYVTRCDQVDYCSAKDETTTTANNNNNSNKYGSNNGKNNNKWNDDQQSLQWETRQLRTIKAATMEHLVQYILLLTPFQQQAQLNCKSSTGCGHRSQSHESDGEDESTVESNYLLEERNNVSHAMHVLFATYRQFVYPWQLFADIIRQKPYTSVKQFNFILFYWLNNYPEDFWTPCQQPNNQNFSNCSNESKENDDESSSSSSLFSDYATTITTNTMNSVSSLSSQNYGSSSTTGSSSSFSSSTANSTTATSSIADILIGMRGIDEQVKKHCLHLMDMAKENCNNNNNNTLNHSSIHKTISKSSSITELDAKFIAQQLTAIDLENFLALKPYTLLSHQRSKTKIEIMIRNFNLLSRHVIVTILQHSSPHLVTIHWIEIAHHLRKMRNFNSLKAIIAGLTNESIHRLKSVVWNKLPRSSLSTFTYLSSIVDDVNNQTLLRHTQLFIEGTSKVSLEESFGTVPYLGTFLTDITMINTRFENYIKLENGTKLINFEKCCKQYEVLMQMQLLQKNAIAALQQQQQQNYHLEPIYSLNHYLSLRSQSVPSIPRVARIFRNWFQMNESDLPSDRECYQISLSIENPAGNNKTKK